MTLINILVQSYSTILLAIGSAAIITFMVGLYLIFRSTTPKAKPKSKKLNIAMREPLKISLPDTAHDVTPIAGDDPMATQLDLARAYIETGKKQFAKLILQSVIREGSEDYQEEAKRLLSSI